MGPICTREKAHMFDNYDSGHSTGGRSDADNDDRDESIGGRGGEGQACRTASKLTIWRVCVVLLYCKACVVGTYT